MVFFFFLYGTTSLQRAMPFSYHEILHFSLFLMLSNLLPPHHPFSSIIYLPVLFYILFFGVVSSFILNKFPNHVNFQLLIIATIPHTLNSEISLYFAHLPLTIFINGSKDFSIKFVVQTCAIYSGLLLLTPIIWMHTLLLAILLICIFLILLP